MLNKVKSAFGGKKVFLVLFALILTLVFFAGYSPAQAQKDQLKLKVFVHYPNPGRPASVSSCTPTTSNPNDYGIAGWQMPASGLNYSINFTTKPNNLTSVQVQTAISNSFATWTLADAKQIFKPAGSTLANNAKYDGINAILFKSIRSSAIAITYIWSNTSTGEVVETDTLFNSRYQWSITAPSAGDCAGVAGTYDLQNIGTHEFGHWVGLNDLYNTADKDLTMYGYGELQELKKDTLGTGDITGVLAINP